MNVVVAADRAALGAAAASQAAGAIRRAIAQQGKARIVAATGTSQIEFLRQLIATPGLDWQAVELFHLDEYIGLPAEHPASFRRYLREHLIGPAGLTNVHLLDGNADPASVCDAVGRMLRQEPIDVAFVGIGENGHLAFNDPPADFETTEPYLVVQLDEACRRQQAGEGWFATIADVPRTAISMSIHQILAAREIIVVVPDDRKAVAVKNTLEGPITPAVPASILRTHPNVTFYLDDAAAKLTPSVRPPGNQAGSP